MNIAGSKIREQSERFFDINMEIVENIPGKPGSGRSWWVPISRFDNTFKKDPEKSGSSSPQETITIEKPEINNATSEKKDIPVVFTAPAADNTLPDEREKQKKTIKEDTPTITPQVPDSIVNEQNSDNEAISQDRADKKAREFRDRYTEYRKLFMKDQDKDIGKLLNDFFTDVFKSGVDKNSPEEKFKVYEGAIQDLEELKKDIDKILSKRKTSSQ